MRPMKRLLLCCILIVTLLTACNQTPTPNDFPPAPPTNTVTMPTQVSETDTPSAPSPAPSAAEDVSQFAPQASDSSMMRGDLTIEGSALSLTQSQQVILDITYRKPTPCFQLRVEVAKPDAQGNIQVNAYAVAEKDKACTLMALATPLHDSLNLGNFPSGHYSLWLNGTKVGEFNS